MIQIVGIKEANIEVVEVTTAPAGSVEGMVVEQSPRAGEKVDLNKTRVKISIYKPKQLQLLLKSRWIIKMSNQSLS